MEEILRKRYYLKGLPVFIYIGQREVGLIFRPEVTGRMSLNSHWMGCYLKVAENYCVLVIDGLACQS